MYAKLMYWAGADKSGDPKPGEKDAKMIPFDGPYRISSLPLIPTGNGLNGFDGLMAQWF